MQNMYKHFLNRRRHEWNHQRRPKQKEQQIEIANRICVATSQRKFTWRFGTDANVRMKRKKKKTLPDFIENCRQQRPRSFISAMDGSHFALRKICSKINLKCVFCEKQNKSRAPSTSSRRPSVFVIVVVYWLFDVDSMQASTRWVGAIKRKKFKGHCEPNDHLFYCEPI